MGDLLRSRIFTLPDASWVVNERTSCELGSPQCCIHRGEQFAFKEQVDQRCLWPTTTHRFIPSLSPAAP